MGMEKMKQIMYGVTDFARIRAENGYFVDRTALIRELEKTSYAMFLRPRRFGKSLLCAILQCYYDIDYADRFDALFGGVLYWLASLTPLKRYMLRDRDDLEIV